MSTLAHGTYSPPILPARSAGIMLLLCSATLLFDNGIYLFLCFSTLVCIISILWRTPRPGILLFAFIMQWTQVVAFPIWMNVNNWGIDRLSEHAGVAVICSCIGLLVMALVIERAIRSIKLPSMEELRAAAGRIDEKKLLILYLISTFFLAGVGFAFGSLSGLAQVLTTISYLKWIFFLVYGYKAWITKKNRLLLAIIILFEFTTSLYSYFSSFKDVILMTLMIAVSLTKKVSFKQLMTSILVFTFLGVLGVTWTAVKNDYRSFLNNGNRHQEVSVSRSDAYNKIGEQVTTLTWKKYQLAMNMALYRLQYVYHLARTMDRVPTFLPYEYGGLWWSNITFVITPRILFPDKPIYEATKKTNKYTGLSYTGYKTGSSFSLGYFADCYIDFGYLGMFFPLAMIGLFVSFIYRSFMKLKKVNILFRFALINVCLYEFTAFEADGLFFVGRLLLMFLVYWAMAKYLFGFMEKWMYKRPS